ncbi:DUF1272 domain-containing protein [Sulfitobacter sediminilitoris]|nr:DUF1272 domain-containing protein [Sulfitobacter sediminilitoris]
MSDKDLPQEAKEARICIYECTFFAERVDNVLKNVCPYCARVSCRVRSGPEQTAGPALADNISCQAPRAAV